MKFNTPTTIFEIIPNLAWMYESKVIISLYSLREVVDGNGGCDFEQAVEIVKKINSTWNIVEWCFDWTAERDLELYDRDAGTAKQLFEILSTHLLSPIGTFVNLDHVGVSFIHGDVNIKELYNEWAESSPGFIKFNRVDHVNRFFYLYNQYAFPSLRPQSLISAKFTSFNRKFTSYRSALLEYLKKHNLIHKGYVNFAFDNTSTLTSQLPKEYEGNMWQTESDICKYYSASNFDIIMETTSTDENRTFITEKTLRALALGQPFVTFNGPNALSHLQSLGFKTYNNIWNEEYDSIANSQERFNAMMHTAHELIENTTMFDRNSALKEISLHNQFHFQKLSQKDHRQVWFESF